MMKSKGYNVLQYFIRVLQFFLRSRTCRRQYEYMLLYSYISVNHAYFAVDARRFSTADRVWQCHWIRNQLHMLDVNLMRERQY